MNKYITNQNVLVQTIHWMVDDRIENTDLVKNVQLYEWQRRYSNALPCHQRIINEIQFYSDYKNQMTDKFSIAIPDPIISHIVSFLDVISVLRVQTHSKRLRRECICLLL